jgi:hypothetical protein
MEIPHTALETRQTEAINPVSGLLKHNEVRNSRLLPAIASLLSRTEAVASALQASSSKGKEESLCREIKGWEEDGSVCVCVCVWDLRIHVAMLCCGWATLPLAAWYHIRAPCTAFVLLEPAARWNAAGRPYLACTGSEVIETKEGRQRRQETAGCPGAD